MAKGFFDDPSAPVNLMKEMGMAIKYRGTFYYPKMSRWSYGYEQPTFFDLANQKLIFLGTSKIDGRVYLLANCLSSTQTSSQSWNWAFFSVCNTRVPPYIAGMWTITNTGYQDIGMETGMEKVTMQDYLGDNLWLTYRMTFFTASYGVTYPSDEAYKQLYFTREWIDGCKIRNDWDYCVPLPRPSVSLSLPLQIEILF